MRSMWNGKDITESWMASTVGCPTIWVGPLIAQCLSATLVNVFVAVNQRHRWSWIVNTTFPSDKFLNMVVATKTGGMAPSVTKTSDNFIATTHIVLETFTRTSDYVTERHITKLTKTVNLYWNWSFKWRDMLFNDTVIIDSWE